MISGKRNRLRKGLKMSSGRLKGNRGIPKKDHYRDTILAFSNVTCHKEEAFSSPVESQEIELRSVGTIGMNKIQNGGRANWII